MDEEQYVILPHTSIGSYSSEPDSISLAMA